MDPRNVNGLSKQHPYFDQDGRPMSLLEWSKAYDNFDGRLLARDVIGNVTITTVWHGVNTYMDMDEAPSIFGTLVQCGTIDEEHEYTTKAEAVKIAELAAGKPDGMPSVHRFRFRHEP